jgi:hypothetical protein
MVSQGRTPLLLLKTHHVFCYKTQQRKLQTSNTQCLSRKNHRYSYKDNSGHKLASNPLTAAVMWTTCLEVTKRTMETFKTPKKVVFISNLYLYVWMRTKATKDTRNEIWNKWRSYHKLTSVVCILYQRCRDGNMQWTDVGRTMTQQTGRKGNVTVFEVFVQLNGKSLHRQTVSKSKATRHEGAWGERRYRSYSFSTSARDGNEWSASRPGRVLPQGKGPPVPIVQEAGWAPEPVWTQRLEEKSLPLKGIEPRSPGRPARSHTLYWLSYPDSSNSNKTDPKFGILPVSQVTERDNFSNKGSTVSGIILNKRIANSLITVKHC